MSYPIVPRLHVVTDDAVLARQGFVAAASSVLEAGGDAVALHVRGPKTSGRTLFGVASRLRAPARRWGSTLLVNDRVDVALAADADGAHLGERSLPVEVARALMGAGRSVSRSVHGPGALAEAAASGTDFVFAGTVFASASHPDRPGIGAAGLSGILAAAPGIPGMGIGGIDVAGVPAVLAAGAHGVAVLSGIWGRRDPAAAVLDYLAALDGVEDQRPGSTDRREEMEEKR